MFLFFFKDGGCRMSPRFHLFVSDVNQGTKEVGWAQDFLVLPQEWIESPWIFCKLLNIESAISQWSVGVWNS